MAPHLGLEAKELAEPSDSLFVLSTAALSRVALPVHEGVVKLIKALWQAPCPPSPNGQKESTTSLLRGLNICIPTPLQAHWLYQ